MYICRHAKHPLFLSDINKTLIFSTYFFRKILKYQIWWKFIQWDPCCSMWTDGHEVNCRFSLFCESA